MRYGIEKLDRWICWMEAKKAKGMGHRAKGIGHIEEFGLRPLRAVGSTSRKPEGPYEPTPRREVGKKDFGFAVRKYGTITRCHR
jgi:hypothetical protein